MLDDTIRSASSDHAHSLAHYARMTAMRDEGCMSAVSPTWAARCAVVPHLFATHQPKASETTYLPMEVRALVTAICARETHEQNSSISPNLVTRAVGC